MQQIQKQQLQQRFSPQQIQLMRLLQLPVTDLEQAIKEEVEKNPLLEAEMPVEELPAADNRSDWDSDEEEEPYDYRERLESDPNAVHREFVVADSLSFTDRLMEQLSILDLTDRQRTIASEIVGTLDDAGYLGRDLALVANDMAFRQGLDVSEDEAEEALHIVQGLEPAGIGARTLQECLLLQLERMEPSVEVRTATEIVRNHFDDFAAHRYDRITTALDIEDEQFDNAAEVIRHLNPKPGSSDAESQSAAAYVTPDIILTQHDGQLQFFINDGNLPRLSLNTYYTDMLAAMEKTGGDRETLKFLRTKQGAAQEFIDLLQQRHETMTRVMRYIMKHQRQFLLTGNADLMQPMRQREVAEATGLDISTVSRMANSKYLQTDFGTIPLKDCFSKGMATDGGEVSVESIKKRLADAINAEDKHKPLSDEELTKLLSNQGLPIARRTVAKYREQLGFPVARLRRLVLILLLLWGCNASAQMSYYDSIIHARLEASRSAKAVKAPAKKAPKEVKAPVKKAPKAEDIKPEKETPAPVQVPEYLVPLWYTDFPAHRVNPMGRTNVATLPDEINLMLIHDSAEFCFPVRSRKTSNYGWRWNRGHHGVDIGLRTGDPVHAAFSGTVRVAGRMGGYGNCVVVRHANGLETLYGHLSKINVKPQQEVSAGEVIGLGGSTGNSTGPHLHFECRFLYQTFDPEWILDFETYGLRTRRLHLDKSYFGITKPRRGEGLDYKADQSSVAETRRRPKNQAAAINPNDF
ncbi:MAG: RNA polymerase factor sigma-54 [Bacteroidales bacterium]|nr:RNA polymerase factor sigma-54 [Bacteroidales bacterium]